MTNAFSWRIAAGKAGPEVQLAVPGRDIWLTLGSVPEVLEDIETPQTFAWRHFHSGLVYDMASFGTLAYRQAVAQKRAKDEVRNAHVCSLWLQTFGLRVGDTSKWRALSLNTVLHFQFGPCLTAATNGVDVLLVSSPSLTADWILAHRSNVIGPVTGTEVSVAEWNWLSNSSAALKGVPRKRELNPDGTPKLTRKEKLALL